MSAISPRFAYGKALRRPLSQTLSSSDAPLRITETAFQRWEQRHGFSPGGYRRGRKKRQQSRRSRMTSARGWRAFAFWKTCCSCGMSLRRINVFGMLISDSKNRIHGQDIGSDGSATLCGRFPLQCPNMATCLPLVLRLITDLGGSPSDNVRYIRLCGYDDDRRCPIDAVHRRTCPLAGTI